MAVKRKVSSDVFPGPDGSSINTTNITKRLSLGWGAWEKYHQHGQDLARKGKYEEAIQVLTEALLQKNTDTVKIMDSRSAVYCRMGMYEKALSDAKHMIRAAAKDERGYLRAGKALLLAEKPEKALDIYAYALKSLGEQHPHKEAVTKIHSKLAAKLSSRHRDPIFSLNSDCLLQILQHLPFRQIVSLTRVSKAWRIYIKDQPILWSDISFQDSKPPATPDAVRVCIRNSQNRVKRLQLHNVRDPLNAALQASRCPRLEHIDIDGALGESHIFNLFRDKHNLKSLILSNKIPLSRHMLWTMVGLPNLERIEVRQLALEPDAPKSEVGVLLNLKSLTLNMKRKTFSRGPTYFIPFWVRNDVLDLAPKADMKPQSWFDRVPNLQELRLSANEGENIRVCFDGICHHNLRTVQLSRISLYGTWKCPDTVEHLYLIDCNMLPSSDISMPQALLYLRTLVLRGMDFSKFGIPDILSLTTGTLETLQIENCDNVNVADLSLLTTNDNVVKNLRELHLCGMGFYDLENSVVLAMLALMPQLKELHIPHSKVTGTLIRRIVETAGANRIKILNLKGCSDVSPEAVDYGRAHGLKIIRC
ncbi:hypothetical protein TMatcc_010696 [Talaromyces marneffei ATCC 18224]|uniref:Leucine Rich Repeat domain protein n=2 Tax=Talaromyces marneffei TaxID=37727 RepID=B6QUV5_TALMQ|nr:Leucine Rich Repeat domain protein [Talaromyces marneffei ATCC 18224]